jgi:3-methyladenine DNA glycosylase AlkD
MPVILRILGYKFFFYQADLANEPAHVHVGKDGNEAKFWLAPVKVAREGGFRKSDLRDIERIIDSNLEFLLNAWEKEKSKHVNG